MSIFIKNFVLKWIEISLLESHIHDTAQDFEQIFAEVLRYLMRTSEFNVKIALFGLNLFSYLWWVNEIEVNQDIENIYFPAIISLEFDMFNYPLKVNIKISQFPWVLFLNLNEWNVRVLQIISISVHLEFLLVITDFTIIPILWIIKLIESVITHLFIILVIWSWAIGCIVSKSSSCLWMTSILSLFVLHSIGSYWSLFLKSWSGNSCIGSSFLM